MTKKILECPRNKKKENMMDFNRQKGRNGREIEEIDMVIVHSTFLKKHWISLEVTEGF